MLSIDDLVFGLSIMDEDQRSKEIRRVWVVACVLQIGDQLRDVFPFAKYMRVGMMGLRTGNPK